MILHLIRRPLVNEGGESAASTFHAEAIAMKRDIYEQVTNRVLELLAAGVAPWRRPWKVAGILPTNLKSGKVYRGINVLVLAMSRYASPYWLTYHQAQEQGGRVRAGEKGTQVVFWKFLRSLKRDGSGAISTERDASGSVVMKRVPLLRHYTVFNLEQIDGIAAPKTVNEISTFHSIDAAEKVIAEMPNRPAIRHGGAHAFYESGADRVTCPVRKAFKSRESYYATMFHELVHSTGHASRLARPAILQSDRFGGCDYSKEELVAELGAAFLCAQVGIEAELEQSAAYLRGWMEKLSGDSKLLVQAAGQAQRASDYMLGVHFDDNEDGGHVVEGDAAGLPRAA